MPTINSTKLKTSHVRERGFTMMELMVVMGVTLFGLAGVMSLYMSNARGNKLAQESAEAIEIADEAMEDLRGLTITEIETNAAYAPITSAGWGPLAYHLGPQFGRKGVVFRREISAVQLPSSSTLIRFTFIVTWGEDGIDATMTNPPPDKLHSVTFESVRTRLGEL